MANSKFFDLLKKLKGQKIGVEYVVADGGQLNHYDGTLLEINEEYLVLRYQGATGIAYDVALNFANVGIVSIGYDGSKLEG